MDSLETLTVDGQLRPNQPAIEDSNKSLLDIEDDTYLSKTEEDIRDIEIPDAQPKQEDQAPRLTRGGVMRNPVENQLGQDQCAQTEIRHAELPSESGRQKATSSHGSYVPQH